MSTALQERQVLRVVNFLRERELANLLRQQVSVIRDFDQFRNLRFRFFAV